MSCLGNDEDSQKAQLCNIFIYLLPWVYKPMSWIKKMMMMMMMKLLMMMMMMINRVILKSQTGCIMGTGLKCNFCTGLHRWEADRLRAMGWMQSFSVSIFLLTTADAVLPLEWMKYGFQAALNKLSDCYCSHGNMWNVLSGFGNIHSKMELEVSPVTLQRLYCKYNYCYKIFKCI